MGAVQTLDRLRVLEHLYRQGVWSEVFDRTIDKLLAMEVEQTLAEKEDLERRLAAFETQYGMGSADFYRRFRAGELGDEMDFVEWSVFYEMYQALLQRLDMLGAG